MTDRNSDRKYVWYTCGKCGHENYRLKSEEEDDCSECGAVYEGTTSSTSNTTTGGALNGGDLSEIRAWKHRSRKPIVPAQFRIDLANPNG
jgi:DNA-directed RNA polymerase subunit RPC12/RpoP